VRKAKVSFIAYVHQANLFGTVVPTVDLSGKSYTVSVDDEGLSIEGDPPREVGEAEVAEVTEANDDFFIAKELAVFPPRRALKLGETLQPPSAVTMALVGSGDGYTGTKNDIIYRGFAGANEATFDVDVVATADDPAFPHSFEVKGTLRLQQATGWPTLLELEGPVTGKVRGMAMEGTMKTRARTDYESR
jgi:hypothetical protein